MSEIYEFMGVRWRRTNPKLAFHPLFVFLPVLLLYLLEILNGLDEFRLDQRGLFDYHAKATRLDNDATQKNYATQHAPAAS
jgi:hypothetical protein